MYTSYNLYYSQNDWPVLIKSVTRQVSFPGVQVPLPWGLVPSGIQLRKPSGLRFKITPARPKNHDI